MQTIGLDGGNWLAVMTPEAKSRKKKNDTGHKKMKHMYVAWVGILIILLVNRIRTLRCIIDLFKENETICNFILKSKKKYFLCILPCLQPVVCLTQPGFRITSAHAWYAAWLPIPFSPFSYIVGLYMFWILWHFVILHTNEQRNYYKQLTR